jgi:hypothetical protein
MKSCALADFAAFIISSSSVVESDRILDSSYNSATLAASLAYLIEKK